MPNDISYIKKRGILSFQSSIKFYFEVPSNKVKQNNRRASLAHLERADAGAHAAVNIYLSLHFS